MIRRLLIAALIALPGFASAQAVTQDDVLTAQLLPGWRTASGTYMVALQLDLAPEWKTYWRSPGDAGIPPSFNWSGSQNLSTVRFHWPRPHVFYLNEIRSIGYKRQLVLPFELTPADPSQPISLRAEVDLGICRDICMPASLKFASMIGGAGEPDPRIDAALAARPETAAEAGLRSIGCSVEPTAEGVRLIAELTLPMIGGTETVVFEPADTSIWASESIVQRQGKRLTATTELISGTGAPIALDRSGMIVTVLGDDRAVEIRGCPEP
ncbi:MAG: hypothetical protein DI533_13980 [Cereibacter sphaeroides]|uniref:Thiol:disulfide interchange protein DsbD N-terminal domain-containing protein n=1 Tax=Cereibacter sphaeroides TaxID=1063 RepID=A0A2W5S3Q9_CERSP|nr:MAG: hypothetical protein DI533_13980 [Cereibacter sphaeroides]